MFKDGDKILVTAENGGQTVAGTIEMITPNQVAAMLTLDGSMGHHVRYMAVQCHDSKRGIYRSIIDGTAITMRARSVASTTEGREKIDGETTGDQ